MQGEALSFNLEMRKALSAAKVSLQLGWRLAHAIDPAYVQELHD